MTYSVENEVKGKIVQNTDTSICQLESKGDLTRQQVKALEEEFMEALSSISYKKVILKFIDATAIDSPGLALCLGLYKECEHLKQEFEIHANHDIVNIFKFTNLDRILTIKEIN